MQENRDKQLDTLIEKVMKKASLETPSQDFTANVMSQIVVDKKTTITYRPIISRNAWFMIALSIIVLVGYILLLSKSDNSSWLSTYNLSFLSNNIFSKTLSEITYSSTTVYVVLSLTTMICVQLVILKKYFRKQLEA